MHWAVVGGTFSQGSGSEAARYGVDADRKKAADELGER